MAKVIFVAARMQPRCIDTWVHNITQQVDKFRDRFSGTVDVSVVFDQNVYAEERLNGLYQSTAGCLVVMVVICIYGDTCGIYCWIGFTTFGGIYVVFIGLYEQQIHKCQFWDYYRYRSAH